MTEAPSPGAERGWGHAAFWPAGERWRGILWAVAIFGAYYGTVALYPWVGDIALLWLPNAVLATAMLKFRPRDWPYVGVVGVLAEVIGDLRIDMGLAQSVPLGVVNVGEATLFVLVAARIAGGRNNIGLLSLRGALGLVIGSIAIPTVTGAAGAALVESSWTFGAEYLTAWRTWWFGDSLGLLVGVPIGLLLRDAVRSVGRRRSASVALAGGGVAVLLFAASGTLDIQGNTWAAQHAALAAAVLVALTFGAIGAPIGAMFTTIVTIIGFVERIEAPDDITSIPRSQVFLFVVFAALYAIAAATESLSHVNDDLHAANTALSASLVRAEAGNRAKSKFLSTMSHELRTPLNSILGFSDLLRRDPTLSADQRGDLGFINRSGTHLLALIDQVLDMARLESGQTVLEASAVDLPLLVNDVDLMMRGRFEAVGLQFVVEVADDVPRYITCDQQKLRQIMLNLLSNSLKFTSEGQVSLRVRAVANPGLQLVIEVQDSGAGIAQEDQQRIFEPFVQLQEAGATGTGLGLSIVSEYVRLMGGSVEVTSQVGVGSLFRVNLPVVPARPQDVQSVEEPRRVLGLAPGQPQWRVLVVDDEPPNRVLLGRLLADAGFMVAFAEDGAQCLKVFGEFRPQFIWMDRRMPVMDGVEATSRIRRREDGREVKIAGVTASLLDEQREEWVRAGVDGIIGKPFREAEIFDCMQDLLGVEYVYQEPDAQLPPQLTTDLSAGLSGLPEALRSQLAEALVVGTSHRLEEALGQVRQVSPGLADALDSYIREFNYSPVLDALDAVHPS